jgi:hypothetical protein
MRSTVKRLKCVENNGLCDLCREAPGVDLHEIINRARTRKGSEARQISYRKELCALLCRNCHNKAHNPEIRAILLDINRNKYGHQIVDDALNQLKEAMKWI